MTKIVSSSILIALVSLPLFGATHLSDDIGGKIFEASGNPYIVDQDIVIPKNTQTVIKAGCVFLFKSFTGINVYGSMLVEGTAENPIVFSSVNDANHNPEASQLPNAFDWNGIYVGEESGDVKLRNFKLMYSVFGIKSKKDEITIQNGYFKQNGQFHFTINDNIHYVQDNISYSYNVQEKDKTGGTGDKKPPVDDKKPKQKSEKSRSRIIAGVSLLSVGALCGVACIITGVKASQYKDNATHADTPDEYDTNNDKFKSARLASILTGITSGGSILASLPLFIKKDKSTMTQKVSLNIEGRRKGIGVGFTRYF